jgi:mannose-6-phosphate isomerase-like protein (cupin superfamily)
VPLTNCAFLVEEPAGSRRVDVAAGASYRRDAGAEHNIVNGGERPMSFIEVELKP